MWKFLNTIWGSYIKVSLGCMISWYLVSIAMGEVDPLKFDKSTIKELIVAGIAPFTPMLINWRNRHDPRYGKKPKAPTIKPDADAKKYKE